MKARVVSGMRPTGQLHLGHLVGALKNWVPLQDQYECFYFVADWHALTSEYADTSGIVPSTYDMVTDWIAGGLEPEKSTFFIQSLVPEHAELFLLLSMVVPVGADQVAHLEFSRETVRRFNNFFGDVLVEPQALLTAVSRLPGIDGDKKMSKSIGNTIHLSDDADTVKKRVMQMYTDPKRVRADIPGTVEGNPVFIYHDTFNPDTAEVEDLKTRYRVGKVGDVEVKTKLAKALNAHLEPIRARRAAIMAKPGAVRDILLEGSKKARIVAEQTMARVREAAKLGYR